MDNNKSNKAAIDVNEVLKQAPMMKVDESRFDAIMDDLAAAKRKQNLWFPMAAMMVLVMGVWILLPQVRTEQSEQMQLDQLIHKVNAIELAVLGDSINHSAPGSEIIEKMISMENWLVQLNANIASSPDEQQTLALLNAKLEVLDDLVALQKKLKPQEIKTEEQPVI